MRLQRSLAIGTKDRPPHILCATLQTRPCRRREQDLPPPPWCHTIARHIRGCKHRRGWSSGVAVPRCESAGRNSQKSAVESFCIANQAANRRSRISGVQQVWYPEVRELVKILKLSRIVFLYSPSNSRPTFENFGMGRRHHGILNVSRRGPQTVGVLPGRNVRCCLENF